jgi:CRISPR-associated protein Cmr2
VLIDLSESGPIGPEARDRAQEALREEIGRLAVLRDDPAAAFVALWGVLPARLRARRGDLELGALWDLLPADTRMPNHSVAAHQVLVSALAAILADGEEAALLTFSIGPVQGFIAQARRTTDLWAGSALLSRALVEALRPLVTALGPDHVIFPALRRSDRFLQWLVIESPWADRLGLLAPEEWLETGTFSGLPNRFLAVVPQRGAAEIAGQCEERVRTWWEDEAARTGAELEASDPRLEGFGVMAREQSRAFLQVSWAGSASRLQRRWSAGLSGPRRTSRATRCCIPSSWRGLPPTAHPRRWTVPQA